MVQWGEMEKNKEGDPERREGTPLTRSQSTVYSGHDKSHNELLSLSLLGTQWYSSVHTHSFGSSKLPNIESSSLLAVVCYRGERLTRPTVTLALPLSLHSCPFSMEGAHFGEICGSD